MKLDMHCHVKEGSIDSKVSLDEYITLLKERGFDGMLITDHDTYKGYRHWKYQMKGKVHDDFVVLKGIEYDTCDGGHILLSYAQNGLLHLSLAVLLLTLLFGCVQKDNSMTCSYLYLHYLEPLREWIRFLSQSQFSCSPANTSLSLNQSIRLAQKRVCPLEIHCSQMSENALFRRL